MKRKKAALLIIGCLIICLIVLRESGAIDASSYKSALSISQTSTVSRTGPGEGNHFSYHVVVMHNGQTLYGRTHFSQDNLPPIEIEATLGEPVYSGNCALPLMKNFKMAYQCEFKTVKSPGGTAVAGKIEGEVTAAIYGPCSRRKARALAFEDAKEQVISCFQKLNP
jgi:hypothetical protein